MKNFTRLFALVAAVLLTGTVVSAQTESCGPITLELYDSYGDGWNGNDMDVISNSGTTTTYTLSSGSSGSYALTVGYGDTLSFSWQGGGSWATECTYVIKDASGNTLYTSPTGALMTAGATQVVIYCNTIASCPMPSNLTVTTTPLDAGLSWSTTGSYLYHLVEYDTAGFTPGTGDTLWVYDDTTFISGLNPATAYDFRVTTICSSSDSSSTASALSVYTQCAALSTPLTENFEGIATGTYTNPSLPQCWEYTSSTTYPYWYVRNLSTYANSGSQMIYGYKSSGTPNGTSYGDTAFFSSPVIQGLSSGTKQVEFYSRTSSTSYTGMVLVGVTDQNASTFKVIDTVYSTTSFQKHIIFLNADAGVGMGDDRVAFAWIWDGTLSPVYDAVYIDDITIDDIPPCPEPILLTDNGTTQTTANISWTSTAISHQIEFGEQGFVQGTGTLATTSNTSYTLTGLSSNTYYDYYVRGFCSATDTSDWEGPYTFHTECGDLTTPYSEGFEGMSGGNSGDPNLPECWKYAKTGTSTSFYAYNYNVSSYANTGSNSLRFYGYASTSSSNSADGDTLAAFSPRFSGLNQGNLQVSFAVRSASTVPYYNNKLIIAVADSNASLSSIHIVDTVTYTSAYSQMTVNLENLPPDASRIVFMIVPEFVSGYSYSYTYAYVDDIQVIEILPCETPGIPVVNYTTGTQASLSWLGSGGSNFNIKYGPQGFNQATGATQVISSDSSVVLTGLQPSTSYDVYVQNNCSAVGDGLSYWTLAQTFTTKCDVQPLPISQNFENTSSGSTTIPSVPECWDYFKSGDYAYSVYGYTYSSSAYSNSGSQSFRLYSTSSTSYNDSAYFISPNLGDMSNKSVVLDFAARPQSTSSSYNTQLYVRALDSMNNEVANITLIQLEQEIGAVEYGNFSIRLDSIPGASKVAFMLKNNGNVQTAYLDDISISEITECFYVQDFTVDSIGTDMVEFSWDTRFSDSVQVTIVPEGLGKINGTSYTSASGSLTVNGLVSGASYDVYYDEFCSTGLSGFEQMTTITTSSTMAPCEITFELYDSYGDGWNGHVFGYRLLNTSNDTLGSGLLTMSTGSSLTITESSAALYQADSIEVYYVSGGSYSSEVSMSIYDGSGTLVDSIISGSYFNPFRFATGCSGGSCFAPALSISTGLFSASFVNTSDTIRYSMQAIGTALDPSSVIESTDTLISLNGLNYYSGYQVYYQVPCSSGGWTPWAVKFFETGCDNLNYSYGSSATTYCYGSTIQFALSGNATAELFSWYHDGMLLGTSTSPLYAISDASLGDQGIYSVAIENRCGSQTIYLDTITVIDTISITSASSSVNTCLDLDAQIEFNTTGPFTSRTLVFGAATTTGWPSDSIGISSVSYSDSGEYVMTISNTCETKSASVTLNVIEGTTITSISPETYVCTDSTEAIYVAGLGNSLQYSWTANGVSVANSNNDTILVPSPSDSTFYAVQVSGICSADTSKVSLANSSVVVRKRQSSEITTSQSDLVLCEGQTIDLGFEAIGHNLQYSWLKDGNIISGANDTTFEYANAMHGESGTYQFAISGTCGVDTSAEVAVDVRKTTEYLAGMSNIEVCVGDEFSMPLSYDGHDVSVTIHKVGSTAPIAPTTSTVSGCGELFFSEYIEGSSNNKGFEIFNPSSNAVSLSGYTVYLSGNGGTYTNTFTSNATIAAGDVYVICTNQASSTMQAVADTILSYPSVSHYNGDDALILVNGTDTIDVIGVPGVDPGSSWTVGTGSTANHTLVRKANIGEGSTDWATGSMEWDVYAQNTYSYLGSHTFTCSSNTVSSAFGLSNITYNDEGYYYAEFDGSCGTVYSDTILVTVHTTTAITSTFSNPLNVICEDAGIDFSFAVEGHGLTYAWNQDGSAAGSDSTLQITTADTAQSGYYQLITTGTCGVDSSQVIQLIVHPTTRVLSTFVDTAICQDADMTLPVATDGFNVTYKWYQNGTQISTSSSLAITDGLSSDNGEYLLALNGYCGTDSSNTFDVLVMPTTEVFTSLGDTTTCIDDAHVLAVVDTGYMNMYQWYKNGTMLTGETDSTLTFSALTSSDTGLYQLVASGSCGTDSSAVISLGAWKTTTLTASSPSFDICKGDQALMYMDVDGDFVTYSWAKDGFNLPGSTNDTLILNNVQPAFAGYFIGTATGICGTTVTDSIQMSVHQIPNVVQEPVSDTLCQYDNTSLTVNATGFGVTYDWYFNGAMVGSGATLALDSIIYAQQGNYVAVADGFCGVDSSQAAYVKVEAILPSINAPSVSFEICELDTIPLNATSLLGQSISAEWYRDSTLVGTSTSYNLTDSGMYYVVLTDLVTGCVESTPGVEVIERPVPQPIAIYGEDTLAQNLPSWYWVALEPNVDYDWSIPTGAIMAGWFSDSVEIKFSGSGAHMVYLEAKNQYDCTTDLELQVWVSGIGFMENELVKFTLYPNPTIGWTVLELDQVLSSNASVRVVDAKGATVMEQTMLKGEQTFRMDLTTLRNGQYMVVIPELGITVPVVKAD